MCNGLDCILFKKLMGLFSHLMPRELAELFEEACPAAAEFIKKTPYGELGD